MDEFLKKIDGWTHGHAVETIVFAALLLVLHVVICVILSASARKKGHAELFYFFLCLILGMVGYVITAALTDNTLRWAIEDTLIVLENNDIELDYCKGSVAKHADNQSPEGTVAYMPKPKNNDESAQTVAAEKLKQFWNRDRSAVTYMPQKKKSK